jgi:hypothetical protein
MKPFACGKSLYADTKAHMAGLFAKTPPSIIPKLWPSRLWIRAGGKYVGAAEVARAISFNRKSSSGGLSSGSMLVPLAFQPEVRSPWHEQTQPIAGYFERKLNGIARDEQFGTLRLG